MSWYAIKTYGRETVAMTSLRRLNIRAFWPETHTYFKDRRTQREKRRVAGTFPGYAFVAPETAIEYSMSRTALGVAYFLGSIEGERFEPKEIPAEWIECLIEAGPLEIRSKIEINQGDMVKTARGALSEIIGTYEGLDKQSRGKIKISMFGKEHVVHVPVDQIERVGQSDIERLEAHLKPRGRFPVLAASR